MRYINWLELQIAYLDGKATLEEVVLALLEAEANRALAQEDDE